MKFYPLLVIALMAANASQIQASTTRKSHARVASVTPRTQEIYSATESDAEPLPAAAGVAPVAAHAQQAAGIAAPRAAGAEQPAAATQPVVGAPPAEVGPGLAYDPVPSDQIDAISRRLQIVETLIRRHGRAYDYRTHTLRELEQILVKLDAAARPAR